MAPWTPFLISRKTPFLIHRTKHLCVLRSRARSNSTTCKYPKVSDLKKIDTRPRNPTYRALNITIGTSNENFENFGTTHMNPFSGQIHNIHYKHILILKIVLKNTSTVCTNEITKRSWKKPIPCRGVYKKIQMLYVKLSLFQYMYIWIIINNEIKLCWRRVWIMTITTELIETPCSLSYIE